MSEILIDYCSRAELIKSGQLIEVEDELLKEVGIKYPTAVTCGVSALLDDMPKHESFKARVFDMLNMFTYAAKGNIPSQKIAVEVGEGMLYEFILNDSSFQDKPKLVKVKAVVGPGDYPEEYPFDTLPPPALTFMLPEEE